MEQRRTQAEYLARRIDYDPVQPDVLALLKRLEWCRRYDEGGFGCPECSAMREEGHYATCALAAAIAALTAKRGET